MKLTFKETDANKIIDEISSALGGRELGKIVNFDLKGETLQVTISKMGTSTLNFAGVKSASGWTFSLEKEKIAFAHRPFKDDVVSKIMKVVESIGGQVS